MNRQQVGKWITATSLALGAAAVFAQQGPVGTYPQVPVTTDGTAQSTGSDNYGFCSTFGADTTCYHNWLPARAKNKVLLYTRTATPVRQASLGTPLAAGLNPPLGADNNTQNDMIRLLNAQGIAVDYTEDVHALTSSTANLNQYASIIFFGTTGDVLWDHGNATVPALAVGGSTTAYLDAGRSALRQYVRAGGGFVSVSYALGQNLDEGVSDFPWLTGLLGANIYDSAGYQNGTIVIQGSDPSTAGLAATIPFQDRWFTLVPYPRNVKFLATLDRSTLATPKAVHPGHGVWPVAWCHYYDGGRAWVTSLGTDASALSATPSAGAQAFQTMLINGIKGTMGVPGVGFCT